jgi:hypothetical protein
LESVHRQLTEPKLIISRVCPSCKQKHAKMASQAGQSVLTAQVELACCSRSGIQPLIKPFFKAPTSVSSVFHSPLRGIRRGIPLRLPAGPSPVDCAPAATTVAITRRVIINKCWWPSRAIVVMVGTMLTPCQVAVLCRLRLDFNASFCYKGALKGSKAGLASTAATGGRGAEWLRLPVLCFRCFGDFRSPKRPRSWGTV